MEAAMTPEARKTLIEALREDYHCPACARDVPDPERLQAADELERLNGVVEAAITVIQGYSHGLSVGTNLGSWGKSPAP